MASDHRTLGKLYPRSNEPGELGRVLTEQARQHEFQLQTNVSVNGRLVALEKRANDHDQADSRINDKLTEIAVAIGKVKGAMWAIGVVWTVLVVVAAFVIKK